MKKQKASIDRWDIEKLYDNENNKSYHLRGFLISHPDPHFNDGHDHYVRTSKLIKIDFENNTAETLNTIYELKGKDF